MQKTRHFYIFCFARSNFIGLLQVFAQKLILVASQAALTADLMASQAAQERRFRLAQAALKDDFVPSQSALIEEIKPDMKDTTSS